MTLPSCPVLCYTGTKADFHTYSHQVCLKWSLVDPRLLRVNGVPFPDGERAAAASVGARHSARTALGPRGEKQHPPAGDFLSDKQVSLSVLQMTKTFVEKDFPHLGRFVRYCLMLYPTVVVIASMFFPVLLPKSLRD